MDMKKIIFALAASLMMLACLDSSAQRYMPGQFGISIQGTYDGSFIGGRLTLDRYTRQGYWDAGVTMHTHNMAFADTLGNSIYTPEGKVAKAQRVRIYAQWDYMWRILSTRRKNLAFYAGGGPVAGVEAFNIISEPSIYVKELTEAAGYGTSFIYGLQARVAMDFFIAKRFAITASGDGSLILGGKGQKWGAAGYAGFKFLF